MLPRQQLCLSIQPAGVSGQAAVRAQYAVAGYDEGDPIASHRAAHGLRGHPGKPPLRRQTCCQLSVGHGLSVGDLQEQRPHRLLERGTGGMQRRPEVRLSAGKVDVQPALGRRENRRLPPDMSRWKSLGKVLPSVKPEAGQTALIRRQ